MTALPILKHNITKTTVGCTFDSFIKLFLFSHYLYHIHYYPGIDLKKKSDSLYRHINNQTPLCRTAFPDAWGGGGVIYSHLSNSIKDKL